MASLILFILEQDHVRIHTLVHVLVCIYIYIIQIRSLLVVFFWNCRDKHMIEMPESRLSVHLH